VCNDFGNNIPYSDYLAAFSQTRIPVKWPNAAPNLEPRDDIWPTDRAPVIRRLEDGTNEFSQLRWGFPPARSKGPLSSISVPRVDGSRSVGVWYRHHIFSSLPARNHQRRSGNSQRSARTGSASPVYGVPWRRVVKPSRC
jgi:putative SOS response-associated peptidase YedK